MSVFCSKEKETRLRRIKGIRTQNARPKKGLLLCITRLLLRVNVPDDVIRQPVDAVAGPLGHFRKPFGLGLILKGVAGEVDAWGDR